MEQQTDLYVPTQWQTCINPQRLESPKRFTSISYKPLRTHLDLPSQVHKPSPDPRQIPSGDPHAQSGNGWTPRGTSARRASRSRATSTRSRVTHAVSLGVARRKRDEKGWKRTGKIIQNNTNSGKSRWHWQTGRTTCLVDGGPLLNQLTC